MNIAVIQWQLPIQIHTTLLINVLAESGHKVHMFLFDVTRQYSRIAKHDNIYTYNIITFHYVLYFIFRVIRKSLSILLMNKNILIKYEKLYRWLYIKKYLKQINIDFDFSIGIEKGGLICANALYKIKGIPYYYYSLELYVEDHPVLAEGHMKWLRSHEMSAHKEACGTFIQDIERANALYEANGLHDNAPPFFLMPVSVKPRKMLTAQYDNQAKKRKLLLFGINRLSDEECLIIMRSLPKEYVWHIHNVDVFRERRLFSKHGADNIILTDEYLDEDGIDALMAGAHIGLCWYASDVANDRLTAFSSEKTSRYLSLSIPIIANAESNFPKLFSIFPCGVAVSNASDISYAIMQIECAYNLYSDAARDAYEKFFNFENAFTGLMPFVHRTLPSRTCGK